MQHTYMSKVQVLVVDDQGFSRRLLRLILGTLGCRRVSEAKSVETAWSKIILSPPDLLIVDWEMPESSGLELVLRVRNDDDSPDPFMPIIMLTAYSELPRIVEARDAGINEYVVKPISPAALFKRLDEVIEHPRKFVRTKTFFGPDRRRKNKPIDGNNRRKNKPEPEPTEVEEA
ncbi:MAG: response regulator [Rhodospirillales bacterium]|nr:response regulator [Alphaproteobacteria bacterium]MBL6947684.1 response regulator [Rhodospirillales bacterium]